MSNRILLIAASVIASVLPISAQAQWKEANNNEACMQIFTSGDDSSTLLGLANDGGTEAMLMLTVTKLPPLEPNTDFYQGLIRFDGGEVKSAAFIQQRENQAATVSMSLPIEQLDLFARTSNIQIHLENQQLADISPPSLSEAVTALKNCISQLPPKNVAEPLAKSKQTTPHRSTDEALAAAIAAGDRVAANEPQGAIAQTEQGADFYPQGEADTMLMMMRMNNRLINNGGDMADPSMGAVMQGLEY